MKRTITRRTIWSSGVETEVSPHSIDFTLVAHEAAVETLQIDLVAKGWVGLFGALLVPGTDTSPMVWSADGPGGEAEIKRAYSALFGRFFGRAVLRHEHNCIGLRQVRDGMTLAPGIKLERRVPGLKGDLPDWVGWIPSRGCFTICEAKGSYEKASWSGRHPPILREAKKQLDRVRVVDAGGRLQTKNWVVACRWGTSVNGKPTTIITDDPLTEGRVLSAEEAKKVSQDVYAHWLADMLEGLGWATEAKALRQEDRRVADGRASDADVAKVGDRKVYAALVVDGQGVFPLRGKNRKHRLNVIRALAQGANSKMGVLAVDTAAFQAAQSRRWVPDEVPIYENEGRTIILDGVLFTSDVDALKF